MVYGKHEQVHLWPYVQWILLRANMDKNLNCLQRLVKACH
jgi:hypothetical protein